LAGDRISARASEARPKIGTRDAAVAAVGMVVATARKNRPLQRRLQIQYSCGFARLRICPAAATLPRLRILLQMKLSVLE